MIHHLDISKVLFLDIETVPEVYKHKELDEKTQYLWNKKTSFFTRKRRGWTR